MCKVLDFVCFNIDDYAMKTFLAHAISAFHIEFFITMRLLVAFHSKMILTLPFRPAGALVLA